MRKNEGIKKIIQKDQEKTQEDQDQIQKAEMHARYKIMVSAR
jgi:hypothetical protein